MTIYGREPLFNVYNLEDANHEEHFYLSFQSLVTIVRGEGNAIIVLHFTVIHDIMMISL